MRMQVDEVPQDVPLDGLNEGLATALQPLEEICAAEAHQPLAGARQVEDDSRLGGRRRVVWAFFQIVAKAIAGKSKPVDGVDDGCGVQERVLVASSCCRRS